MEYRRRMTPNERKKKIREVAKELFLKNGYKNTTMESIVEACKMSKGGVYRYYGNTSEILHDIMLDGNRNRVDIISKAIDNNPDLKIEDIIIESMVTKMLDKAKHKSLYAMFLIEADGNEKLGKLRDKLFLESQNEMIQLMNKYKIPQYQCLLREEWINFCNSIIVSTELLGTREVFNSHKDMFRDMVRNYIKKYGDTKIT